MRQNEDMRKISAWVAIVAVPTMVAGIYGMNFEHMPELGWRYGYPLVLAVTAVVCVLLYRNFKRAAGCSAVARWSERWNGGPAARRARPYRRPTPDPTSPHVPPPRPRPSRRRRSHARSPRPARAPATADAARRRRRGDPRRLWLGRRVVVARRTTLADSSVDPGLADDAAIAPAATTAEIECVGDRRRRPPDRSPATGRTVRTSSPTAAPCAATSRRASGRHRASRKACR